MRAALALAARGLGRTWPNPAVGCVLVRDGIVVGRGWTQPGGRPHAETEALGRAGEAARGATAYVSLEPCAHAGKTPPCADALIAAGVRRVVAAVEDPDPRVSGQGLARLRGANIAVVTSLCAAEAAELNAGFFTRIKQGRPLVSLKLATSLDGRIATRAGDSKWITGEAARRRAHLLRTTHDAILVGTGTALADDPELTCRLPGLTERSPVRVALDRALRLPAISKLLATTRDVPTWIVTAAGGDAARRGVLQQTGAELIDVPTASGHLDLRATLSALGARGITRLLVEGGGTLSASFLQQDLVDRVYWFRAPAVIGGDGLPAAQAFGVERLADAKRFERIDTEIVGTDVVETFRRFP
jgi:diaminohydroxyphosphoribosylaminopyrimidine deaminase / 5-amino-6-(5-phosphoribosylamino)uracil reductase